MVLSNPFPGHTALTTFADLRRDLEGMVVRNAAGVMRAGVFPDHLNPIVTGRSDMKVNIGDFRAVQNRGGAVLLANVGTDTSVTLPAAPGANKRIDLIYLTMRSAALGDAASTPIFGFVQGTASATPVAPPLPANLSTAIPLATVEIPAGATTTLSAGVVITQVYPYTALAGGVVPVRNTVELAAWTPADGARAYCISDSSEYVRGGGAWWQRLAQGVHTLSSSIANGVVASPGTVPTVAGLYAGNSVGFTPYRAGIYDIIWTAAFGVATTGRTFLAIGGERLPVATGEDRATFSLSGIQIAADELKSLNIFQTTGGTRTVTSTLTITRR